MLQSQILLRVIHLFLFIHFQTSQELRKLASAYENSSIKSTQSLKSQLFNEQSNQFDCQIGHYVPDAIDYTYAESF